MREENIVRLSLNLPALERLLGGNSEVEIQLRHQVVEQFAKKYLKSLIADDKMRFLQGKLREEITEYIGKEVYNHTYGGFYAVVKDHIKMMMDKAIKQHLEERLLKLLDELLEKEKQHAIDRVARMELKLVSLVNEKTHQVMDALTKGLDARMDAAFEQRVQAEVQRRLTAAANLTEPAR